jgi:hypothetical protein
MFFPNKYYIINDFHLIVFRATNFVSWNHKKSPAEIFPAELSKDQDIEQN